MTGITRGRQYISEPVTARLTATTPSTTGSIGLLITPEFLVLSRQNAQMVMLLGDRLLCGPQLLLDARVILLLLASKLHTPPERVVVALRQLHRAPAVAVIAQDVGDVTRARAV